MAYTNFPNGVDARPTGFLGDLTGSVIGGVQHTVQVAAADGAITIKSGKVIITKAGVAALTLADPTAVTDDGKTLEVISTTANAHTVTIAGGLNGAGAGADLGTFTAVVGNRFQVVAYNGKWWASGANVNVTFA